MQGCKRIDSQQGGALPPPTLTDPHTHIHNNNNKILNTMSQVINHAQTIASLKISELIRHELVRNQFIFVYNATHQQGGEAAYEREAHHINRLLRDNEKLRKATPVSLYQAFIDLAIKGLSLETGAQATCYLMPRSARVTTPEGKDQWETRLYLTISGYGELVLRKQAGQILHADNPTIVYEGDQFSYGETCGKKYVNYACNLPRKSNKIVACFLKITRPDSSIDYATMVEADWKRLEAFSAKNNAYFDPNTKQRVEKANELYNKDGQIDAGFLAAKCIKHAFKSYPKITIGRGTQLESDIIDQQEDTTFDPYAGVTAPEPTATTAAQDAPSFATPTPATAGHTITPTDTNDDVF